MLFFYYNEFGSLSRQCCVYLVCHSAGHHAVVAGLEGSPRPAILASTGNAATSGQIEAYACGRGTTLPDLAVWHRADFHQAPHHDRFPSLSVLLLLCALLLPAEPRLLRLLPPPRPHQAAGPARAQGRHVTDMQARSERGCAASRGGCHDTQRARISVASAREAAWLNVDRSTGVDRPLHWPRRAVWRDAQPKHVPQRKQYRHDTLPGCYSPRKSGGV